MTTVVETTPTLGERREREAQAEAGARAKGEAFIAARAAFAHTLDQQNAAVSAGMVERVEELGKQLPELDRARSEAEKLHEAAGQRLARARRDRALAELPVLREESKTLAAEVDTAVAQTVGVMRTYRAKRAGYIAALRDSEQGGAISHAPGFEKPRTSLGARIAKLIEDTGGV